MEEQNDLLEPVRIYNSKLKDQFHHNAESFFDELTKKAGTDIGANRVTANEYKQLCTQLDKGISKRKGLTKLKGFLIAITIIALVAAIALFVMCGLKKASNPVLFIVIGIVLVLFAAGMIVLLAVKIRTALNDAKKVVEKLQKACEEKKNEGFVQMQSLNASYDWNIPISLVAKTTPLIQLDTFFSPDKYEYLHEKYGFNENTDESISSIYAQSGSILGNPFVIERDYSRRMGTYTYEGSITISWTTTIPTKDGYQTVTHTQTLTATVTKPKPYYYLDTCLIFGSEAAPKLSFSRQASDANKMSEKDIDRYVKSFDKKLDKMIEESLKKNQNFTPLTNTEFEALFNALNRDNEVEFRLLFTPLAQKSMIELIKSKVPFGDNFSFVKNKCLNYIDARHMENAPLEFSPMMFNDFDYDNAKLRFLNTCDDYFRNLFFQLAPLLTIPLYQQHKAFEYIYQQPYYGNITRFEVESMANSYSDKLFKNPISATPAILKSMFEKKEGKADRVTIRAHSYKTIERVEIVTKMGGDGKMHDIPVHWLEYIPITQDTPFMVQECKTTYPEFKNSIASGKFDDFARNNVGGGGILFKRGLISFIANKQMMSYNDNELNTLLNLNKGDK